MEQYTERIGWEEYTFLDFAKRLIKPKPVLVDVGANVGQFTHAFSQKYHDFTGFAFEPVPATYEALKANVPECVKAYNYGLSDSQREQDIWLTPSRPSCSSLYHRPIFAKESVKTPVKLTTLDLVACIFPWEIDYMKIDVEGHEYQVLQGGKHMFYEHRFRCIHFEYGDCWPLAKNTMHDMLQMLSPLYTVYNRDMKVINLNNWTKETYDLQNFLAVMK